jgi:hypothetical protein
LNAWRSRSGLPGIEEPPRSDDFSQVVGGELEILALDGFTGDDDDEDGMDEGADEDDSENATNLKVETSSLERSLPALPALHHDTSRPGSGYARYQPMISHPNTSDVSLDIPDMYGPHRHSHHVSAKKHPYSHAHHNMDNMFSHQDPWAAEAYALMAQRSMYTPPGSGHGLPSPAHQGGGNGFPTADHAFFASLQQRLFYGRNGEDSSSPPSQSSFSQGRERAGSLSGSVRSIRSSVGSASPPFHYDYDRSMSLVGNNRPRGSSLTMQRGVGTDNMVSMGRGVQTGSVGADQVFSMMM